jgi:hypothetical protein
MKLQSGYWTPERVSTLFAISRWKVGPFWEDHIPMIEKKRAVCAGRNLHSGSRQHSPHMRNVVFKVPRRHFQIDQPILVLAQNGHNLSHCIVCWTIGHLLL